MCEILRTLSIRLSIAVGLMTGRKGEGIREQTAEQSRAGQSGAERALATLAFTIQTLMVCQLSPPSECNDKISPQERDTHMHDYAGVWPLREGRGERTSRREGKQPNTLVHHLVRISYGPYSVLCMPSSPSSLSLSLFPSPFLLCCLAISWNSMLEHK